MAKRFTDTEKYRKPFIRGLKGAYKVLWDFLYHECSHAGIWIVDFEIAQLLIGKDLPVSREEALKQFNSDELRVVEFDNGKRWFIPSFVDFQYGKLNPENRVHNSIIQTLEKYDLWDLYNKPLNKPLVRPSQGCKDMDMDHVFNNNNKNNNNNIHDSGRKRFKKPSPEDVTAYGLSIGFEIDGQRFCDYYAARGWNLKKNQPMKDWKAAVRTWKRNQSSEQPDERKNQLQQFMKDAV